MIYFNSDYLEGAHPSIMVRLAETNMVQTVGYGEDEYCEAAREKIKADWTHPHAPDKDGWKSADKALAELEQAIDMAPTGAPEISDAPRAVSA